MKEANRNQGKLLFGKKYNQIKRHARSHNGSKYNLVK